MSHIGSHAYYDEIYLEFADYIDDGYIAYLEGVQPGTEENTETFTRMLWVDVNEWFYAQFSAITGLTDQEVLMSRIWENISSDSISHVDLSIDDIVAIAVERDIESLASDDILSTDDLALFFEEFSELPQLQKQGIQMIYRSFLKGMMLSLDNLDFALKWNPIFDVILEDRNKFVISELLASQDVRVLIQYWSFHFEGMFDLLKENDVNWSITREIMHEPFSKSASK